MGSRRMRRVEESCKEELSELIHRRIKDPRIGFVTITRVKVSRDLAHARVYISVMGNEEERRESYAGLDSAKGYLRSSLGKILKLRTMPELEFILDDVTTDALRLEGIIKELKDERDDVGKDRR